MTGLLITYVALNLMDGHGQPALLYIVPFTLGNFCNSTYVAKWMGMLDCKMAYQFIRMLQGPS